MSNRPRPERVSQNRLAALFAGEENDGGLGYSHYGDWSKRDGNRNIEIDYLRANLKARGYSEAHIAQTLTKLETRADVTGVTLYQANMRTYQLLRYGVPVQVDPSNPFETVQLIDWDNINANEFAIAEEVTLKGGHERRPDIVLYINGIAVGVIELKRSSVEIGDGVRQLITNQEEIFNKGFFSTVQLVWAGSDASGVRYGTTGTPEGFFVEWKDDDPAAASGVAGEFLDRSIAQMCRKERLLDLIRNCVVYDAGHKKVPRQHQFKAMKLSQERLQKREGGVIWHTQGSGKSILMVMIAKWILENDPDARVLVVTDRDELDKQIEGVMRNAGVVGGDDLSPRVASRAEFVSWLGNPLPRLICALVHKFDSTDLNGPPPAVTGRFYVFVDECHRTQGGDMNRQMKRWLEGAIFIGFTGTPLLRRDKEMTRDVFGAYIHTYKFHEAVEDKVVLDLKYDPRNVSQRLSNKNKIDEWFDQKTKGLNNFQKAVLRKRWANMEDLMSAQERKQRIVAEIIQDFSLKPRLNNDRGTAILVAASIYDACHYYRLFHNTTFGQFCGLITSYQPNHNAISREPPDSDERYKFDTYTKYVLEKDQTTTKYEDAMKRRFVEEPANLKLLIVVSKLLTGFDAPSCTYIYLDNKIRDHDLFQAICRTNRLDGDDKDFGYIVDFKELFRNVQNAIAVYNSDEIDVDEGGDGKDNPEIKNWLDAGKDKLDQTREALRFLVEPVADPKEIEQYLQYFCGDASDPNALNDTEALRISYYKVVASFVRTFAAVAQNLVEAGYTKTEAEAIRNEIHFHSDTRAAIKKHSGEELDIKPYEADMRHLINTYIQADPAEELGGLSDLSLTELIIKTGIHDAIAIKLNEKGKLGRKVVAEGIINNIRKTIIRDQLTDPRFYEQMSKLFNDLIRQSRDDAEAYEAFLRKAEELVKNMASANPDSDMPSILNGRREANAIYNNLSSLPASAFECPSDANDCAALAVEIDDAIRQNAPANFKGDEIKERMVRNLLFPLLAHDREATAALFEIVINQPGY